MLDDIRVRTFHKVSIKRGEAEAYWPGQNLQNSPFSIHKMVWGWWPPASLHIHSSPSLCQSWVMSYWSGYNTEGLLAKPHFEDKLAGIWTPATWLGEHSGQWMNSFGHRASLIPFTPLLWGVCVSAGQTVHRRHLPATDTQRVKTPWWACHRVPYLLCFRTSLTFP